MARNVGWQVLRGILANIPTLLLGEFYLATDTHAVYIGTGAGNVQIGGGAGSGNFLQTIVNFGSLEGETIARVTLTGLAWVTGSSVILCNPFGGTTVDHDPDDAIVEELQAYAENIVPGVGFDVVAVAPNGTAGHYLINVTGQ